MKRLVSLLTAALLALTLTACGGPSPEELQAQAYEDARVQLNTGAYQEALLAFRDLGDYEDARAQRKASAFGLLRARIEDQGSPYTAFDADGVTFVYDHALVESAGDNVSRFAAVDGEGKLVFGSTRQIENMAGQVFWIFTDTLDEKSAAVQTAFQGHITLSVGSRSTASVQSGSGSFDMTAYTEDTSMDMNISERNVDYRGQETTADKQLSAAYHQDAMAELSALPAAVLDTFFSDLDVTLGDLGFTAMDEVPEAGPEEGEPAE